MSQKLSKKFVLLLQLTGGHGQIVRRHAIVVSRQEQEHVLTILRALPMSQKLGKKLAKLKNAVSDNQNRKQSTYSLF